jgi:hypothetical protein
MQDQRYYFKISPENIIGDLVSFPYTGQTDISVLIDPCCPITSTTINQITGTTGVYLPMSVVLSGGTNGESLLSCLTIPLLFTENINDLGYYTPFDGAIYQKDVMTNFIYSSNTSSPYDVIFLNTSETEYLKFLSFNVFVLDWGDGSPTQNVSASGPLTHTYPTQNSSYEITLTSYSPWGISIVKKEINLPYTGVTISNPNGTAYFTPVGCNWTGTPISYDYIFTGDSNTTITDYDSSGYTTTPFTVTGYTKSSINDLKQYGPKINLFGGKFKLNVPVTGGTGVQGMVIGPDPTNTYTAYTINDILYLDFNDGTTVYSVQSYGLVSSDYILTAITKNEALLNVIDEPQIQSNLFMERGKISGLEAIQRLGEVDNLGDISKYGYGYFKVKKD